MECPARTLFLVFGLWLCFLDFVHCEEGRLRGGQQQQRQEQDQWQRRVSTSRFRTDGCQNGARLSNFQLSQNITTKTLHAAELTRLTYSIKRFRIWRAPIPEGNFETMDEFADVDDGALVARLDNVCYVGFQSTRATNVFDIWQLFDKSEQSIAGCKVRRGFYRGYYTCYYDNFLEKVEECMAPEGSELVVTGHSQGGSVAMMAFLDLQKYNPIAIAFGSLPAFQEHCNSIDSSRIYRFSNTGDHWYDTYANSKQIEGVHMGESILLDAVSTSPAVYLGLDESTLRTPKTIFVHPFDLYENALTAMVDKAQAECPDSPVRLRGWEDGHWCTR